jgi:hypothetical protein
MKNFEEVKGRMGMKKRENGEEEKGRMEKKEREKGVSRKDGGCQIHLQ